LSARHRKRVSPAVVVGKPSFASSSPPSASFSTIKCANGLSRCSRPLCPCSVCRKRYNQTSSCLLSGSSASSLEQFAKAKQANQLSASRYYWTSLTRPKQTFFKSSNDNSMTSRVIAPFSSSSISSNKNNNDNSNPALAPKTQQDTFSPSNEKFESVSEINVTSFSQIMGDAANGDAANLAIKTSEMDVSSSSSRVYKSPVCPDPDKCTPTSDVRHLVQKESVHNGSVITRGRAFSDATAAFDIATESPLKGIKSYPTTFSSLGKLLEANKSWASATAKKNPTFFKKLADQQTPQLLWIGWFVFN